MFTYINENFLHAPSTDLSRDTVKTLIQVMLAQGQEVFLEKQIADGKKVGLLAKLASQAAYLYSGAIEGTQENVNKAIFEKVWLLVVQVSSFMMTSTWLPRNWSLLQQLVLLIFCLFSVSPGNFLLGNYTDLPHRPKPIICLH
jgi:BRO1-like domain